MSGIASTNEISPGEFSEGAKKGRFYEGGEPSLPSANLTCVGLCMARNALKNLARSERMRKARAIPRPRPMIEPTVTWVESLPAEASRVSRSDWVRLDGRRELVQLRHHTQVGLRYSGFEEDGRLDLLKIDGRTHVVDAVLRVSLGLFVDLHGRGRESRKT